MPKRLHPSPPIHHLQSQRLDLLQPVDRLDEFSRQLAALDRSLDCPVPLLEPHKRNINRGQPRTDRVFVLRRLALLQQLLVLLGGLHFWLLDLTGLALLLVLRHRVFVQIRLVLRIPLLLPVLGVCDEVSMAQLLAIVIGPMEL